MCDEDDANFNPYGLLGYGYQAYFSTLQIFGLVLLLMCILMLPAFSYYYKTHGIGSASHGKYNTAWMLGNMGFNKAVCLSDYVQLNATRLVGCEVGYMSKLQYAGIIPNNLPYDDSTNNTNYLYYGFCGDPNNLTPPQGAHYPPGLETCTNDYLLPQIFSAFESNCTDQKSCNFSMTSFVNLTSNNSTACTTNPAKVYMQYFCLQTTD